MFKYSISDSHPSPATEFTAAPTSGRSPRKTKSLLWLALPLALAGGCASGPSQSTVAYNAAPFRASTVAPVYQSQATNVVIGREIFEMFMKDTSVDYGLSATVNNQGLVSLGGTSSDRVERQRIVDEVWQLHGVNEVKDKVGVDVAPSSPQKDVVVR